jgi:hypothetical protein
MASASTLSAREILCVADVLRFSSSRPPPPFQFSRIFHLSLHLQKLVEIVRSRNTKRRRRRIGASGDDFAVEMMGIVGSRQVQEEDVL